MALFLAFFAIFSMAIDMGISITSAEISFTTQIISFATATAATTWFVMRFFEQQPVWAVGIALQGSWRRHALTGMIGGVCGVAFITLIAWATGTVEFQSAESSPAGTLLFMIPLFVISATTEELLFRGYPFQRLVEGTNGLVAIVVASLLFGYLHSNNPHATDLSMLNTVLAGVLFSVGYLKTSALWLPMGFHFSWNWMLTVFGWPVSGLELARMPWQVEAAQNSVWLHGGDYGPEGGILATVVLMACIAFLKPLQLVKQSQHGISEKSADPIDESYTPPQ